MLYLFHVTKVQVAKITISKYSLICPNVYTNCLQEISMEVEWDTDAKILNQRYFYFNTMGIYRDYIYLNSVFLNFRKIS